MKNFVAAVAAVLAVLTAVVRPSFVPLTPLQVRDFGREQNLPLAVVTVGQEGTAQDYLGVLHPRINQATATLVDAHLGLYLTAAHILPPSGDTFFIMLRDGRRFPVRWSPRWAHVPADLAVLSAGPGSVPEGVRVPALAEAPPQVGEVLTLKGYHLVGEIPEDRVITLHGFIRRFQVILPATDGCVSALGCILVDILEGELAKGQVQFSGPELRLLYRHRIFALHMGPARYGLVPGLSGSPLMDAQGTLVAVASGYRGEEPFGTEALMSPAYVAEQLIRQAREDLSGGS